MSHAVSFRDYRPEDAQTILRLNEAEVPHVGELDLPGLLALAEQAHSFRIAETPEREIAGFILALGPAARYSSPNFLWFRDRYPSFVYVDRLVVAKRFKGIGIGRKLYAEIESRAGTAPLITCEVNLDPPNPDSIAFHTRIGFREVGRQRIEKNGKTVSMMARDVRFSQFLKL